jgi:acyl carrier protein
MKLLRVGEARREGEAERWAARSFPGRVPLCAAPVAVILAEHLNCEFEDLSVDSPFEERSEFTELDQVKLFLGLEEKFGLSISDEDAVALTTPAAIIAYIERKHPTCAKA